MNESLNTPSRAQFGSRLGAFFLDLVFVSLIAIILVPVFTFWGIMTGAELGFTEKGEAGEDLLLAFTGGFLGSIIGMLIGFLLSTILAFVLYSLLEALSGASPGKMILGLKVANQDGTSAGVSKKLLRWTVKYSGVLFAFAAALTSIAILEHLGSIAALAIVVGCFFVLGAARLSFHDMASGTAVYKKSDII